MPGLNKKPAMLVGGIARNTIDSASKAALVDLVGDFLRLRIGREDATDEEIATAFVEAMEPVAVARGDKKPSIWQPPRRRTPHAAPVFCSVHRRLRAVCECNEVAQ